MKKITLCEPTGKTYKPKERGEFPAPIFKLMPGTAWKMDDKDLNHEVVEVSAETAAKAEYQFTIRTHDGRLVREFKVGDTTYAQPDEEHVKAGKEGRTKAAQPQARAVRSTRASAELDADSDQPKPTRATRRSTRKPPPELA